MVSLIAHDIHRHGGMERNFAELAERLPSYYPTRIVCSRVEEIEAGGLEVISIPVWQRPFLLKFVQFLWRVRTLRRRSGREIFHTQGAISTLQPDVITVQFCHTAFHRHITPVSGRAGRKTWARRISHSIGDRLFMRLERLSYKTETGCRIIAVSAGIKRELAQHFGYPAENIRVIPNGVNTCLFSPEGKRRYREQVRRQWGLAPEDFVLLFVGGDWGRKGLPSIIESLSLLPKSHVKLLIVGNGDRAFLCEKVRSHGVMDRIVYVGASRNVEQFYAAADVFVLPSSYEAFPLVVLEAASSGLPILATEINGTEEFIVDGVNGLFIERSGASIAEKVNCLLLDKNYVTVLGNNARESVMPYSWERVVKETIEVYKELWES